MTDEEVLERAFLHALKKHFPKPGPWLPPQRVMSNDYWPSTKGISTGEVWEIYVYLQGSPAQIIRDKDLRWIFRNAFGDAYWFPLSVVCDSYGSEFQFTNIDPVTGDVTGGSVPSGEVKAVSMANQGFLMGQDMALNSVAIFYVRARRRFDLE